MSRAVSWEIIYISELTVAQFCTFPWQRSMQVSKESLPVQRAQGIPVIQLKESGKDFQRHLCPLFFGGEKKATSFSPILEIFCCFNQIGVWFILSRGVPLFFFSSVGLFFFPCCILVFQDYEERVILWFIHFLFLSPSMFSPFSVWVITEKEAWSKKKWKIRQKLNFLANR